VTVPMTLEHSPAVPFGSRLAARIAVTAASALCRLRPHRLCRVLRAARRGAVPAPYDQALAARRAVVAVSTHCAGQGCLRRSVAAALLCRVQGTWPTWCTGVRTEPFRAHAWIEAAGRPVGEPHPPRYYTTVLEVPPPRSGAVVRGPLIE
jgi:Transglutaminase-like superfamily